MQHHTSNFIGQKMSILQRFYNLSIGRKQLIALIASELVSIIGIGVVGTSIISSSLRAQLAEQAKSEVAVGDTSYNIKINQMGFGFRGQSDNAAIINAASIHDSGRNVTGGLRTQVKQILQNEIKAREIEYATLVGRDLKIVLNANRERRGQTFNPDNLVRDVIKTGQQIKASGIVSLSELTKESPPSLQALKDSFQQQNALIRYTATPVKDRVTRAIIGVLISGDIVNGKNDIVKKTVVDTGGGYSAIYQRQPKGGFALASSLNQGESDTLNRAEANLTLPPDGELLLNEVVNAATKSSKSEAVTARIKLGNQTYTMAATAVPNRIIQGPNGPQKDFGVEAPVAILVRGTPETALNRSINRGVLIELLTVIVALVLIGIWSIILRRSIVKPIVNLQRTANQYAAGDRTSRAEVFATDEVGELAVNFNRMADKLTRQAIRQEKETKLALQLNNVAANIRETLNTDQIFKATVSNTREALQVDRVIFYRYDNYNIPQLVAESVNYEWEAASESKVTQIKVTAEGKVGNVLAVENIEAGNFPLEYLQQLRKLNVKSHLLAPVFVNKQLYGWLVAHQCSTFRQWEEIEINLFSQVAIQVGYALEQSQLLQQIEQGLENAEKTSEQERKEKEALQMQLLELLDNIEGAAGGDLTVRADVSDGEIGTVADFFNSIVESLRSIVTKVKTSANQVNTAIGSNENAIRQLAEEALSQAKEITSTLDAVDNMSQSMQEIATSAQEAALVAGNAKNTANQSGKAMDLTVQNILRLRTTVGETAKKVKRLGESTQEINRAVALINQISMQTNLLAINAGIEASRAGGEGQGFAVVAEEVGELAAKSANATKEIEKIVENIQRETSELAQAMEVGTAQVVEGTKIVEDAKHSLTQILTVSQQIDLLVQSISGATTSQAKTSHNVSQLIKQIAGVSERTSTSSLQVSQSLQKTVEISQELQEIVETFKVS